MLICNRPKLYESKFFYETAEKNVTNKQIFVRAFINKF